VNDEATLPPGGALLGVAAGGVGLRAKRPAPTTGKYVVIEWRGGERFRRGSVRLRRKRGGKYENAGARYSKPGHLRPL